MTRSALLALLSAARATREPADTAVTRDTSAAVRPRRRRGECRIEELQAGGTGDLDAVPCDIGANLCPPGGGHHIRRDQVTARGIAPIRRRTDGLRGCGCGAVSPPPRRGRC